MPDPATSSTSESDPLFSTELHEIGTRLVDMLNQAGFLYRYPSLSGVTLACICQHIGPMQRLLASSEEARIALGREKSPQGYTVGCGSGADPLSAAFDYAMAGFRVFLRHVAAVAAKEESDDSSGGGLELLKEVCDATRPPAAQAILRVKDLIESHGERASKDAASDFQPLEDMESQRVRHEIFYFLLDLEKRRKSD